MQAAKAGGRRKELSCAPMPPVSSRENSKWVQTYTAWPAANLQLGATTRVVCARQPHRRADCNRNVTCVNSV